MQKRKKQLFLCVGIFVLFLASFPFSGIAGDGGYQGVVRDLSAGNPVALGTVKAALAQNFTKEDLLRSFRSAQSLRIFRNAYFAVAGVRFRSKDLRDVFSKQSWYRGVRSAASGLLSARDLEKVQLLSKVERGLRKGRLKPLPSKMPMPRAVAKGPIWEGGRFRLERLANFSQFGSFTSAQRAALEKHGFFLSPTKAAHAFEIYEKNDYLRVPSYVTTDMAIDITHTFFDNALRNVEESALLPRLRAWSAALLATAQKQLATTKDDDVRKAATEHVIYWGVVVKLAGGKLPSLGALQSSVDATVAKLVKAKGGKEQVAGAPHKLDISSFQVRGHYTRSPSLGQYFRAMSWLGKVAWPFGRAANKVVSLEAALLLQALEQTKVGGSTAFAEFQAMERVINAFVGASDAASPSRAMKYYLLAYGAGADVDGLAVSVKFERFATLMKQLAPPEIQVKSGQGQMPITPQMRVMGQRAFADSLHLQKVALLPGQRLAFSGLDVASAMGSLRALQLLKHHDASVKGWAGFDAGFAKGRRLFAQKMKKQKETDAYHGTLFALQSLFQTPKMPMFPSIQRPSWSLRMIQTALAGWAELRHDTILYGAPVGAECGLEDQPPPPAGAVEPYPALYARLDAMVDRLGQQLKASGIDISKKANPNDYSSSAVGEKIKYLRRLLQLFEKLAKKQQAGQAFTRDEDEQIATIGGAIESAILSFSDKGVLMDRDKQMPVVADIGVVNGQAFHVAVGKPDALYMIAKVKGQWQLMRGATMSYYEFFRPASNRLTDEAWRKILKEGKAPTRPFWLNEILVGAKTSLPKPGKTRDSCQYSGGSINL
ncbi:MAG: DUF3160 domain-containing protein [Myxococcales bacterium]|nr:DUF3160 domain-containing protein [Myxococcales bacterium]